MKQRRSRVPEQSVNTGEEANMLRIDTMKLGKVVQLGLEGDIVRGETDALRKIVLAQADACLILLDLARVETIDAGGLGVMLELREDTQSRGIEFRVKNVTRLVRQILEITRLDTVFEISEQPEESVFVKSSAR